MQEIKIYVDRLKNDNTLSIDETEAPTFLDIQDPELVFKDSVKIKGEAYLADGHLLVRLDVTTSALIPCCICNEIVSVPIQIKNNYITKPLAEIQGPMFDLLEEIRELTLLQTPSFIECSGGQCPERESIKKFFRQENDSQENGGPQFPFADL